MGRHHKPEMLLLERNRSHVTEHHFETTSRVLNGRRRYIIANRYNCPQGTLSRPKTLDPSCSSNNKHLTTTKHQRPCQSQQTPLLLPKNPPTSKSCYFSRSVRISPTRNSTSTGVSHMSTSPWRTRHSRAKCGATIKYMSCLFHILNSNAT